MICAEPTSSKTLQRRSQPPPVRKQNIYVIPNSKPLDVDRTAFIPSQNTGSGDDDDLCCQRLQAWISMVKNYQEFFKGMAAAELDLATVYARVGDILKTPTRENALMLPINQPGMQGMMWRMKRYQQMMVETHCAIGHIIKKSVLEELQTVMDELKELHNSYRAVLQREYQELARCRTNTEQRIDLLGVAIRAACMEGSRDREVIKDPFILNLEVEALLRKRAEIENCLHRLALDQQARLASFEPQFIERLAHIVKGYFGAMGDSQALQSAASERETEAAGKADGAREWKHFCRRFSKALECPQGTTGNAVEGDFAYAGMNSEWVCVLRQGVVAVKEQRQLFRSTWQSKYGVLTTRGYFHVFRSQGDVVRGAPETSVFLPRAHISMVRSGTLQISAGWPFGKCRIVIQDGSDSLDNWRLLMESACYRNAGRRRCSVDVRHSTGMATPPDSSSEESPRSNKGSRPRRGRPFSADLSMLSRKAQQQFNGTPTKNIYMQPLGPTPKRSPQQPLAYLSPVIGPESAAAFAAYSPEFTVTPAPSSGGCLAGDKSNSNSNSLSSSSGAPAHHPTSLFDACGSQDTESAPLGSLPRLLPSSEPPNKSFLEPYPSYSASDCNYYSSRQPYAMSLPGCTDSIWDADVLSIPDPNHRQQRPRSMIYSTTQNVSIDPLLDPSNPYLGEFLASQNLRSTRSHRTGPGRVVSQPQPSRFAVGPCDSPPSDHHK